METEALNLGKHIAQEPIWLQAWVLWMVIVNLGIAIFIPFKWARKEAWVIAIAMVINIAFMNFLFSQTGYTRLLGLSHILIWTPMLVWLAPRLKRHGTGNLYGLGLHTVFITNALSLIVDYIDLVRYLVGDGDLV
ncbi:MAG: hypothetical protein ACPG06_02195 [Alphaproteobacteria bacterium]